MYSAAAELVKWTNNLEADRDEHVRIVLHLGATTSPVGRIRLLNAMRHLRNCIAIDKRSIAQAADELAVCADHEFSGVCDCVAPF